MEIFAERLLELRLECKISQNRLAKELEVSEAIIHYWETKRSEPTATNLLKIAKYFGVTADYLLGLSDE